VNIATVKLTKYCVPQQNDLTLVLRVTFYMLVEAGMHVCNYVGLFAAFYALIVGDSGEKSEKKEETRGASRLSGTQIETVIKQRQPP